ncbi:hypothetical protein MF271_04275 [Deinococcus sp. KNUC1210]|uniref:hypothetical protein n=1 Tax=Deinococcus sp. KNUC1210 TaxID=2917691 RepID=UPI001EF081F3|nr:hypothetical protein [Deinococcus sp. KNUC1210]ULH15860.1 hypothetical protein MF271_04275 [Deinococcus sp. KNUC1210]
MVRQLQLWDSDSQGTSQPQMISHSAMIAAMYEEIVRLRGQCQQQELRLQALERQNQPDWRGGAWPSIRHAVHFEIDP